MSVYREPQEGETDSATDLQRYVPTPEQYRDSPLLHALAMKGASKDEVIEALYRQTQDQQRLLFRYATLEARPLTVKVER
jgi:hypothetical protein